MTFLYDKQFVYFQAENEEAWKLGAQWNQKRKMWRVPRTLGALRELWEWSYDPQIKMLYDKSIENRNEYLKQKNLPDAEGDSRLRPYQRVDVAYLKRIQHVGIFNEQRTGKSVTALKLVEDFPLTVIVCPAGLINQWKDEVEKWLTEPTVFVVKGTKQRRERLYDGIKESLASTQTFLIIGYETLRNDLGNVKMMLASAQTTVAMIVDEAHRLAGRDSKQTLAVKTVGNLVDKRIALTGTPAQNKGSDVWSILHFLYPDRFTSYWAFAERYFHLKENFFGAKVEDGFKRKRELDEILDLISVNRKRKEVMDWLPPKQYQTVMLELTPKQKRVYRDVLETFEYEEEGESLVDAPSVLAQLTRLRQICLAPESLDIKAPSAKENWLLEWLHDNDEPVIVFSAFSSYLKRLQPKIKGSVILHGGMSAKEKHEAVRTFQTGENGTNVLLSNIKAGGQGWTIDRATTTIFLDRFFVPAVNEQAEDRMVSTTEENISNSLVIDLVCKGTVDERIHEILTQKKSVVTFINSRESLKQLLS